MAISTDVYPNILYSNVSAFAGNTVGLEINEKRERFRIPGITGSLVAFTIEGNSMAPTIKSGDMVICSALAALADIKENEIYVIVSEEFVWVKRLQLVKGKSGTILQLKLISDNHLEYDPFAIEVGRIKKVLKVKLKLTGL